MKPMRFWLLSAMAVWPCFYVAAQEQEVELDPVTVTASLTPMSASKTGRNIFVIKGEQLNRLPVQSIDELIRYLPGLEVQSRGPMGVQSNITIRGGTFQQVLIILDGVRLNDPLTGHFNSYFPISPAEIEQIEILKGASSAIYGTEAVGGVVRIITKSFAAKQMQAGSRLTAQVTSGEFGLRNAQAGFVWSNQRTTVAGGVMQNVADGQPLRGSRGFFNLTTASASIKQQLSNHSSIAYRFAYDDRNFNAQNFYSPRLDDTATEQVITRWHQATYTLQRQKHRFTVDAAYKEVSDKFQLRKSAPANTNYSTMAQVVVTDQYQLKDRLVLTTGAQYISRTVRSNNRGDHQIGTAGVFAVLQYQLGEKWNIFPALRADYNERIGWVIAPQLNASWKHKDLTLRGSVGRSVRDADFTERFNNYQLGRVPGGNRVGNPFLDAETSINYELGADYFISKNFKLSGGWFQRFQNRMIDYVLTPYAQMPRQVNLVQGADYALAKNIATVNTLGAELDLQYNHEFGSKHNLVLMLGAISMRSTSSDTIPSLYVSNHARFLVNYSVRYRYHWLAVAVNGLYKERRPQTGNAAFVPLSSSYSVMNLRVEGLFLKDQLGVFLQADNLWNQRYADILGTVMPNRWLMAGIKLSM